MFALFRATPFVALLFSLSLSAQPAPDFQVTHAEQSLHRLSQDKVVYVDFWASWCGPCRHSFPFMNELQAEFADQGLAIVAINVDVDPADALPFLDKYPATFPVQYDPDGVIAAAFAVPGMPTSYLIKDGEILVRHIGFRKSQSAALKAEIGQYLDAAASEPPSR
ncbi:TlpA disulfide reductase family protein [Ferrimonas pelagia]|uniref:TlpA disulfide reductase family protein n=1 Tax=Ferrimonas pelagia TaxID=1177826 RepID=A0ABP9FG28_9GAMM